MEQPQGATVTLPTDHAIMITRQFDAPTALVYEMWTKPEHVTQWWDPSGAPLAACEIDLRPGGSFRFLHRGTGGHERAFVGSYVELDPPARLVFTTPAPSGGVSTGTLLFSTIGAATLLTMTIACTSRADRDALLAMQVDVGTVRTLENLDSYLGAMPSER